jgi:hypothetical protein
MRLFAKILWLLAFVAATLVWMILFEYGFSLEAFGRGLRQEWAALTQGKPQLSAPGSAPASNPATAPATLPPK